jgi:2-oxoisovalerate dehydrogenase E1 component alpha subunit
MAVPPELQMAVKNSAEKACGLGLEGLTVDGTNVFGVYEVVHSAIEKARSGQGPTLIEAKMYRITPHSSDDDDRTYRSREEVEENKKKDPILLTRQILLQSSIISEKELDEMDLKAKEIVTEAVKFGEEAAYPLAEEAAYPVFVEEIRNG